MTQFESPSRLSGIKRAIQLSVAVGASAPVDSASK